MKIQRLTLENYRFFKDVQTFEFDGKNILLYGENGSGKSSLFYALQKLFRYYQNKDVAKGSLEDAQNIFVSDKDIEKPKITIQIDDKTIIFDEDGFNHDQLQAQIENTGKSKLFLTYKDVYAINAIFKEDLTYKEFKAIFIALFPIELASLFDDFELKMFFIKLDIAETLASIKEHIDELRGKLEHFELGSDYEPIEKVSEGDVIPFIYDTVFYLDDAYVDKIRAFSNDLNEYLGFNFDEYGGYDLIESLDDIEMQISDYTLTNDRYASKIESEEIIIIDSDVVENDTNIDSLLESIEDINKLIHPILECRRLADSINEIVNKNMNSSMASYNDILKFLKTNIEITSISEIDYIIFDNDFLYEQKVNKIDFKLAFAGKTLDNHSQNLNEAKMSALNTAIYFASVMKKKPGIPILVLDDLMISLDMSNRAKMLDFLLDKSNFDDEYQIFIFTHDRAFFETTKRILDRRKLGEWKYYEMFVDTKKEGDVLLESPFVKEFSQPYGYAELAKEHFDKREYPPTANYLRKEVERLTDKYLQLDNLDEKIALAKLKNNNEHIRKFAKEIGKIITTLEKLRNIDSIPVDKRVDRAKVFADEMIKLLEKLKFTIDEFKIEENHMLDRVHFALKDILHPQSHNDLTKPLYSKELHDALEILKNFQEQVDKVIL